MMQHDNKVAVAVTDASQLSRRWFVTGGALIMAGLGAPKWNRKAWGVELGDGASAAASTSSVGEVSGIRQVDDPAPLRIGLVTDMHHANKPAQGTRYYRETIDKFREARAGFVKEQIRFAVELGDLIDSADTVDEELGTLDQMQGELAELAVPWHYVLGNHCVHTLTKEEFLGRTSQRPAYYAFDHGGLHVVILDACFREDGAPYGRNNSQWNDANIHEQQLAWLQRDLARNDLPTVVFVHQRLDRDPPDNHTVRQSPQVRETLQKSGRVVAVFQGHSHQNDYRQIEGIHYCTLRAMIEGSGGAASGYSILDVWPDGTLRLRGGRAQTSYQWAV